MKKCILNSKKICNDCGNCDQCDLNSDKKCDNCGICLELQGYDTKAIGITDVAGKGLDKSESKSGGQIKETSLVTKVMEEQLSGDTDEVESSESVEELKDDFSDELLEEELKEFKLEDYDPNESFDMDENVVYFDDVEGLSEIMNDPEMKDKIMNENYPGLMEFRTR